MGQTSSIESRFRALIVSPAYTRTSYGLDCTIEDGKCWYDLLTENAKVPEECIRWISDSKRYKQVTGNSNTRDIISELESLVQWSHKAIDPVIFIAYSGHGTQQRDNDNDEDDGLDEGWVASDLGFVRDDYLNQQVLAKFPSDARVIAVNDACYNGTVWDTPQTAMFMGGQIPQISQRTRSHLGQIIPIIDKQFAATLLTSEPSISYTTKTITQQPSLTMHSQQVIVAIVSLVYAVFEYNRAHQANQKVLAAIALAATTIGSLVKTRRTIARPTRSVVATPITALRTHDQESLDAAIAKYSASVSQQINGGNSHEKLPIACAFSGFSSSNDKQVSYEGAKNGFFTYQLLSMLKRELVPALNKGITVDDLPSVWTRTGFSIINEIGSQLKRMGINQNPMWQVASQHTITEKSTVFWQ